MAAAAEGEESGCCCCGCSEDRGSRGVGEEVLLVLVASTLGFFVKSLCLLLFSALVYYINTYKKKTHIKENGCRCGKKRKEIKEKYCGVLSHI